MLMKVASVCVLFRWSYTLIKVAPVCILFSWSKIMWMKAAPVCVLFRWSNTLMKVAPAWGSPRVIFIQYIQSILNLYSVFSRIPILSFSIFDAFLIQYFQDILFIILYFQHLAIYYSVFWDTPYLVFSHIYFLSDWNGASIQLLYAKGKFTNLFKLKPSYNL